MKDISEEKQAILHADDSQDSVTQNGTITKKQRVLDDADTTGRLCLSYRLLVWLILCLGSTLAFMGLSTQSAAFTCRRLASGARGFKPRPPSTTGPWVSANDSQSLQEISFSDRNCTGEKTANSSDNGVRDRSDFALVTVNMSYMPGVIHSPLSGATCNVSDGLLHEFGVPGNDSDQLSSWTKESEGWVLAAMAVGDYVIQLPAGILSVYIGARVVGLGATLLCVLTSLLSVPALHWGPSASAVVCFFKGASCGALYPSMMAMASAWSGRSEASLVISIIESGLQLGHATSFLAAATFCSQQGQGWPGIFYLQASMGVVFGVALCLLVREGQTEWPECLSLPKVKRQYWTTSSSEKVHIPYRSIFTSLPVIAIIIAQLGSEWLDCLMVTSLPQFLGVNYNMDATSVELLTSLGFLLSIPVAILGAKVADGLLSSSCLRPTSVRKIFGALGTSLPVLCFLTLTYLDSGQVTVASALYLVATGFTALTDSAWPANCLEVAPAFTGFLISLAEASTAWVWAVCVMVVTYMAPQDSVGQWQSVLYLTGGLMAACLLFYALFASSDPQHWAQAPRRSPLPRYRVEK